MRFSARQLPLLGMSGRWPPIALAASSNANSGQPARNDRLAASSNACHHRAPAAMKPSVSLKDLYAAIPLSERVALQSDLVWTGLYNGPSTASSAIRWSTR
jgi:hypothetical protein